MKGVARLQRRDGLFNVSGRTGPSHPQRCDGPSPRQRHDRPAPRQRHEGPTYVNNRTGILNGRGITGVSHLSGTTGVLRVSSTTGQIYLSNRTALLYVSTTTGVSYFSGMTAYSCRAQTRAATVTSTHAPRPAPSSSTADTTDQAARITSAPCPLTRNTKRGVPAPHGPEPLFLACSMHHTRNRNAPGRPGRAPWMPHPPLPIKRGTSCI